MSLSIVKLVTLSGGGWLLLGGKREAFELGVVT